MKKAHEQVTTGSPKRSGLPCAMVYGLFWALPGVHDLVVTVARTMQRRHRRELGTSQGVPGPHSFAVRNHAARLAALLRPPHPRLTSRDDRDTPVRKRSGMGHPYTDFNFCKTEIFSRPRLDRNSRGPFVGQINLQTVSATRAAVVLHRGAGSRAVRADQLELRSRVSFPQTICHAGAFCGKRQAFVSCFPTDPASPSCPRRSRPRLKP